MFRYEFFHELKYWLTRRSVYLYAVTFISLGSLIFLGSLGLFDPIPEEKSEESWLNSPSGINYIILYFHKLMLVLLPAIVGGSLYKDYKYQAHSIIYSFPLHKKSYLLGRLLAGGLIVVGISILTVIAFAISEQMNGLNPNLLGPFVPEAYLHTFFWYLLPNWIIFGMLTFSVVMHSRSNLAAYLVLIIPFLIQLIVENAFVGSDYFVALFDPFGQNVAGFYQKNWEVEAKNIRPLPVSSLLIFNRFLWLGVSFTVFFYVYNKFRFVEIIERKTTGKKGGSTAGINDQIALEREIEEIQTEFSLKHLLLVLITTAVINIRQVLKSKVFWVVIGLSLASAVFIMLKATALEDFIMVPATQILTGSPLTIYSIVIMLLTFVYAGMMIQKEKLTGIDQLLETNPVPFQLFMWGKFTGMIMIQIIMLVLFVVAGITFQLILGYTNIDPALYFYRLFVHVLLPLLSWTLIAFCVHALIKNYYVGIFILLLGWLGVQSLPAVGIDTYLLRFNQLPLPEYSSFYGFGHLEGAFFLVGLYWLLFGIVTMLLATFVYRLSDLLSGKDRMKMLFSHLQWKNLIFIGLLVVCMTLLGFRIAEGESQISSNKRQNTEYQSFKKNYLRYKNLQPPTIVSLKASIEIYAKDRSFSCEGSYWLVNNTGKPLDTLLIRSGFDEYTDIEIKTPYKTLRSNEYMKVKVIRFKDQLSPGDSLQLHFKIRSKSNTLFEVNSNVYKNGTYLKQDIFPRFGYLYGEELPNPEDSIAHRYHYQSIDADRVVIDLTIGTAKDQIAVGPGTLVKKWEDDERNYYRFLSGPMKFTFNINSATFKTKIMALDDRKIEFYYLHDRMLPSMLDGAKAALAFGEDIFDEFSHDVVRIIEFPITQGTYATLSGNNLVVSEARFLADKKKNNDAVDIGFYVAAHEMLHHWWGYKLIPARAKGATFLTESITEYLMLRLLQQYKGEKAMKNFYDLQKKRYEAGRTKYTKPEPSLLLVNQDQPFISYGKGAITLFDISEKIGKDRFHLLLSDFMRNYQHTYPTSFDFLEFIMRSDLTEAEMAFFQKKLMR